ncbi:MnhB domain-containing protein, partial [Trueperella pyogenes]
GGTILQSAKIELVLWGFGDVKIATAIFFDIGVYLVVIGLILDILRSLGAEIDRHGEIEGMEEQDYELCPSDDARREDTDAEQARSFDHPGTAATPGAPLADHAAPAGTTAAASRASSVGREGSAIGVVTGAAPQTPEFDVDPATGLRTIASDPTKMSTTLVDGEEQA